MSEKTELRGISELLREEEDMYNCPMTENDAERPQPWKKAESEVDAATRVQVQEIKLFEVTSEWVSDEDNGPYLHLRLPYHCTIKGNFPNGRESGEMWVQFIDLGESCKGTVLVNDYFSRLPWQREVQGLMF